MYHFLHRALKKQSNIRIRTPTQIVKYADRLEEAARQKSPEISAGAKAFIQTMRVEALWVLNPVIIYVSDAMQNAFRDIGKEVGIVNVPADIPETAVIGDYIYSYDINRDGSLHYAKNLENDDGVYYGWLDVDDENVTHNEFMQIFMGFCVYLSNFPDQIKPGTPNAKVKPLLPKQKSFKVMGHRDKSDPSVSFIRRPHFRVLGHERFKHNADGTPKVILVKQAEVKLAKNQESYHID